MTENPYKSPEADGTRQTKYGWFWRVPLAIGLLIDSAAVLLLVLMASGPIAMYSREEALASAGYAMLLSIPFFGIAFLMRRVDAR